MKKQRKSRGLGITFIIVCLVLSGCGAGTQEAALGSAEEYVQAAKTALAGQDSFTANFDDTIAMNNAGRGSMTTKGTVTFVKEPLYMKVDTDMGFDNGSQRYILYLQKGEAEKNEDGVNQYMNYDGQWTEMTLQKTDAMNSVQIYNTAENMEPCLRRQKTAPCRRTAARLSFLRISLRKSCMMWRRQDVSSRLQA